MRLRSISSDRRGGIEGLPLQLMIIILVATMGTAIIVGWMGSIETPHSIGNVTVDPLNVVADGNELPDITVTVRDQDGEYLEGATVLLQGMNVQSVTDEGSGRAYAVTDEYGKATFTGLTIDPSSSDYGYLTVTVSMPGYGEDSTTRIMVIL